MCNCYYCLLFSNAKGASVLIWTKYDGVYPTFLLGKEKKGSYSGKYNLAGGKKDHNECIFETARRELLEEYKINLTIDQLFQRCIYNGIFHYTIHNTTPIFFVRIDGLSRNTINPIIENDNNNPNLPKSYKEMERVDWFYNINGTYHIINKKNNQYSYYFAPVSSYFLAVIKKFKC